MKFEDYKNPKTLDKPLTKREEEFVSGLVDHKLSAVEASPKLVTKVSLRKSSNTEPTELSVIYGLT